jgi:hypothetical protein
MKVVNLMVWENVWSVNVSVEMKLGINKYSQIFDGVSARHATFTFCVLRAEHASFTWEAINTGLVDCMFHDVTDAPTVTTTTTNNNNNNNNNNNKWNQGTTHILQKVLMYKCKRLTLQTPLYAPWAVTTE